MGIFTIGYEGLDIEAFVSLLIDYGIKTVVDVRELPLSRKRGFSKKALANTLLQSDVDYIHMAELGCPKPVRFRYREDGDWARYTEGFLEHLKTKDKMITGLSVLAAASNCALLCYEADANFCHRSMVASAVSAHCGAHIKHIMAPT